MRLRFDGSPLRSFRTLGCGILPLGNVPPRCKLDFTRAPRSESNRRFPTGMVGRVSQNTTGATGSNFNQHYLAHAQRQPNHASVGQFDLHRRYLQGDRHEHRLSRLGLLASFLLGDHRLGLAVLELVHPTIVCRPSHAFAKAELIDRQAAGSKTLQPLLPIQIVVQVGRRSAHRTAPHECSIPALQHTRSGKCGFGGRLRVSRNAGTNTPFPCRPDRGAS